jgi:AcrR family transcriptional regulator
MPRVTSIKPSSSSARGTDDTRGRLLAAARDLFLESGPAHFSLREVARRVGVSAAAVYRHFDDREALLDAACTEGFHVFSSYLVRALGERTPRDRLVATAEQYRRFALENPLDYRFIFMTPPEELRSSKPAEANAVLRASTFRFLVDRVSECMAADVLAKADAEKTAFLIWAHVHGLVSLRLSGHIAVLDHDAFASFYRDSVDRLLRGLAN